MRLPLISIVPPSGGCAPVITLISGGLASAILAEERMHLARPQVETTRP